MNRYEELAPQDLLDVLVAEEKELRFDTFSASDAWELGKCIVENYDSHGAVAFEIFINGHCKFSYFPEGTNRNNSKFLAAKRNTVEDRDWSSLHMYAWKLVNNKTPDSMFMPERDYAFVGGGYPIALQNGTVIGSVTVSGLPHFQDHVMVVDSIRKFLGK